MEKTDFYAQSIRRYYPDLSLTQMERIGSGQNNVIWQIGSDLIFRFPKYEKGIEQLRLEVKLLDCIAKHVSLKVPLPIYHAFDTDHETYAFMGYAKIEGEPLTTDRFHRIGNKDARRRIADQLGGFLMKLHSIDSSSCLYDMDTRYAPLEAWKALYDRIRAKLYPFMTVKARTWTDSHFTNFLSLQKAEITPSIIHGDFGTSNILYDPLSNQITGIIDFGSAGIGDPAVDYAALLASYGDGFLRLLEEHYPNIRNMMERVVFYKGTFALQEALFGLEHGDHTAFQSGITTVNTFG
ncbi:MAG TPA: aminoglycoside phosphotransferase family protein [Candidatus Bathyarchaeia archaeon]|nr:aminoglycoside phosphotransferase family protein [Candidatus Bathyarchaeia archaeon]